jgi:hypothetical protein
MRHWTLRICGVLAALLVIWAMGAYLIVPEWWKRFTRTHPSFDDVPNVTHTAAGIPGDPLNVSFI